MSTPDLPPFEELVDLLRVRLGIADDVNTSELHSFRELMKDHADVLPDHFYWRAFDELDAWGHLDPRASGTVGGNDACARLSADGRLYLREHGSKDTQLD
jgi:hypothetical protein